MEDKSQEPGTLGTLVSPRWEKGLEHFGCLSSFSQRAVWEVKQLRLDALMRCQCCSSSVPDSAILEVFVFLLVFRSLLSSL